MKPSEKSRIERNRPLHASPGYAPVVGRGVNKPLPPDRVRELLEASRLKAEAAEAEHSDDADEHPVYQNTPRAPINWEETMKSAVFPSQRRLSSYSESEQRVLEIRLFHGRNTYHKTDVQLSAELDVALEDLGDLAAVVRRRY